jgi:hypothetical protein
MRCVVPTYMHSRADRVLHILLQILICIAPSGTTVPAHQENEDDAQEVLFTSVAPVGQLVQLPCEFLGCGFRGPRAFALQVPTMGFADRFQRPAVDSE